MGLLDDAIREHLELKRRRGADPEEVARQEDEALGDPRSGEFAQPDGAAEPAGRAGGRAVAGAPGRGGAAEPPRAAAGRGAGARADPRDEPWLEDDDRIDATASQPTAEFTPPDAEPEPEVVRPDDEPGADEDVLEETPEFLQETPEHDRLWFEQKPPRDFDFDKLGAARMAARRYTLLDVFTSTRLQGNPLAVVHDADGVPDTVMHAFARETRLSETSFVQAAHGRGRRLPQPHLDDERRGPVRRAPSLGVAAADRVAGVGDLAAIHVPIDRVRGAVAVVDRLAPDALLAIGGGSAIGLAKAVALERRLPIAVVPTTYAGSEMTSVWGITEGDVKRTGRDPSVAAAARRLRPESHAVVARSRQRGQRDECDRPRGGSDVPPQAGPIATVRGG